MNAKQYEDHKDYMVRFNDLIRSLIDEASGVSPNSNNIGHSNDHCYMQVEGATYEEMVDLLPELHQIVIDAGGVVL